MTAGSANTKSINSVLLLRASRLVLFGSGLLLLLAACVNDLDSIKRITYKPADPDERTVNLHVLYSDSGYARVEVFARLAETYMLPRKIIKLKDGIKVNFFDHSGHTVSTLTALYGEIDQQTGEMFVRDSVQLFNAAKQQRLETEELTWHRADSTIFTDKKVTVRTPDMLFYGKGIRTKQDFSNYVFLHPQGRIALKD